MTAILEMSSLPASLKRGREAAELSNQSFSILPGPDVMGHFGFGPTIIMEAPARGGFLLTDGFFLAGVIGDLRFGPAGELPPFPSAEPV